MQCTNNLGLLSIKYLGANFDLGDNFKKHIYIYNWKANEIVANIGRPTSRKRAVLARFVHSTLLHGSPV